MTVNTLTAKPYSNSKKIKISNKKPLLISIVVGIAVIFTFALIWGNLLTSSYTPPREYPQIYIKADGTIQPPTTQIKQEGTLYTLQADITLHKFYIEKNDITLDGNGYKISIDGPSIGKTSLKLGYIELLQTTNVTLRNVSTLKGTKLILQNSAHTNIQECNFLSIDIINSHHITISNKTHPYNYGKSTGLLLYESTNCSIQKSDLTSLKLVRSHHNKILNTNIMGGSDVQLWFEDSSSNLLFGNYINSDVGKLFSMTGQIQDNLIVANNFNDYAYYEPTFSHTGTNTFYHNNFFDANWLQSDPDFTKSNWDNGQTGNYWSNYNGTDTNNDGLGDTPHIIDLNNKDKHPIVNPISTQQEIQPQLPPCNQTSNLYTQTTQEETPQTTLILIVIIVTITIIGLFVLRRFYPDLTSKN